MALNATKRELIDGVRTNGNELDALLDLLKTSPEVDQRLIAVARTQLQLGLMALERAIENRPGFC